jgi:predicted metal-binding protein
LAEALHLQHMVSRARALGADAAAPLPARAVVVDERVALKCRVPLCGHYGVNLMCPPHVPTPAETREALKRYSDTLVVQQEIPLSQEAVDEALAAEARAESEGGGGPAPEAPDGDAGAASQAGDGAGYEESLRASQNRFAELMSALEAEAYRMGYRFAAAFAGGDCVLCDVCAGATGEPCNRPGEARPSMEAVGIDVVATAHEAGLALEVPAGDTPRWTGLLLID